ITLLSLFIAPERGILFRYYRMLRFRWNCVSENILKSLWGREESFNEILSTHDVSRCYLLLVLWRLKHQGWLRYREGVYVLTSHGERRAKWIVRLHRLWEVYLADYLGVGEERVHCNAEEMEHILTKDLEKELVALLDNPKVDPHHQPIPDKVGGI
ncbi:MAG: ABC transporter permease, partial [Chlamydiia bacterium]|nr:ABC transporter permease [Chlamydiia bacterium]